MNKYKNIEFTVATNNAHKLAEIEEILKSAHCRCRSLRDAGVSADPEETGETFSANALIKCEAARAALGGGAVIADDSGLCVDYLDGEPGVHTARYAGEPSDPEKNIDKLLAALDGVPRKKRSARFVSSVCAIMPDGEKLTAIGIVEGWIGYEREGAGGFGYDPIFRLPNNEGLAVVSPAKKNAISHRGRALRKLAFKLRGITKINLRGIR